MCREYQTFERWMCPGESLDSDCQGAWLTRDGMPKRYCWDEDNDLVPTPPDVECPFGFQAVDEDPIPDEIELDVDDTRPEWEYLCPGCVEERIEREIRERAMYQNWKRIMIETFSDTWGPDPPLPPAVRGGPFPTEDEVEFVYHRALGEDMDHDRADYIWQAYLSNDKQITPGWFDNHFAAYNLLAFYAGEHLEPET